MWSIEAAVLLYLSDCLFWLTIQLATPTMLMMGSRLESYGVWQKGMVLYFLAATVVHQSLLAQWLPMRRSGQRPRIHVAVGRDRQAMLRRDDPSID